MSRKVVAAAFTCLLVVAFANRANAQYPGTDPKINNFEHPSGTKTAPVGELGGVIQRGNGPVPMILIPGAPFGGEVWNAFMERNADRYTMYAITPAGYGGTNPPPLPEGAPDFSQRIWTDALLKAVIKLIDRERLERPILVGHHLMGDYYALQIALARPRQIRGVVVIAGRPAMLYPSRKNSPGKPPAEATMEDRKATVQQMWAPFYRGVTPEMWRSGTYQPAFLSVNPDRGRRLYDAEVAVPIPTQLRYFLEYLTTNITDELATLGMPLLVIEPKREWTLDYAIRLNEAMNLTMFGSLEAAKKGWEQQQSAMWGSAEEGVRRTFDAAFQWERLRPRMPTMALEYVEGAGAFVMDDQPEAVDRAIQQLADSVSAAKN